MPGREIESKRRKRRHEEDNDGSEAEPAALQGNGHLEMLSDDEDGNEVQSDDGEVDQFPEIHTESDSEEEEEEEASDEEVSVEEEDEEEEDKDEESDSASDSAESLHVFPKAKTVTSDITGQPKLVYPEIEPDYDSDSSTEDVSVPFAFPHSCSLVRRLLTVLVISQCTGMTIYHI